MVHYLDWMWWESGDDELFVVGQHTYAEELTQCASVSLDVAGRGWMRIPQTGIPTDFALHRAGIGLGFAQGDLHGRVQIGHIQTGGINSYIGIGGESNVYRIQLASVQYRPVDSIQLSAGIVEDFWVESGNHTWGHRNRSDRSRAVGLDGARQRWNECYVVIAKVCRGRFYAYW